VNVVVRRRFGPLVPIHCRVEWTWSTRAPPSEADDEDGDEGDAVFALALPSAGPEDDPSALPAVCETVEAAGAEVALGAGGGGGTGFGSGGAGGDGTGTGTGTGGDGTVTVVVGTGGIGMGPAATATPASSPAPATTNAAPSSRILE
jgi:hypothetical protein